MPPIWGGWGGGGPMPPTPLPYAPGSGIWVGSPVRSVGSGYRPSRFMLAGLGLAPTTNYMLAYPYWRGGGGPMPPVVVNPTSPPGYNNQRWQGGDGDGWGPNNRRAQSYGTSNYAPWNTSPTCSDPTSQYYNPADPSCATGNNPACTNPTYPGYNPTSPACAAVTNAAAALAASTTPASSLVSAVTSPSIPAIYLLGGAVLLYMFAKK